VTLRTLAAATLAALTLAGKAHAATITQQIRASVRAGARRHRALHRQRRIPAATLGDLTNRGLRPVPDPSVGASVG
jgi:hypothetical protein